jgi:glycosyltransferase 2 family protein
LKTQTHSPKKAHKEFSEKKPFLSVKTTRYLKVFIFAFVGVFILWLITRNQDMNKIWDEFTNAKIAWILLALISGIISHIVRAVRWNLLIDPLGETPKLSITFYAQMTGYLANLAVPRLGEITRCGTLARHSKIPFNALAGTVVAERIFDMICLLVLIFLTIVFQFTFLKEFLTKYVFDPLTALLSGNQWLLLILFFSGLVLFILFMRYLRGVNREHQSFSAKLKRQILGFWKGFISLALIQNKIWFLFLSIVIWALYFLTVYLCFFALPGTSSLGIADGFTVLVMGSLGVVAPVPGGVGTYHFIVITTMTELLSVNIASATSYAYISHATQMVTVLLLGALSWLMLSVRLRRTKEIATISS